MMQCPRWWLRQEHVVRGRVRRGRWAARRPRARPRHRGAATQRRARAAVPAPEGDRTRLRTGYFCCCCSVEWSSRSCREQTDGRLRAADQSGELAGGVVQAEAVQGSGGVAGSFGELKYLLTAAACTVGG
jgi:hypothetical protein